MEAELREISAQGLAYVGDAVFELMVRTHLCESGTWAPDKLHRKTVSFVSAKAQAAAAGTIMPLLCQEEVEIYNRGRNAHTNVPKSSSVEDYHAATGLEALFGYLYLSGNADRLGELFGIIVGER